MPRQRKKKSSSFKKVEDTVLYKFLIEHFDYSKLGSDDANKLCLKGHVLLIYLQNHCSTTSAAKIVASTFGFPFTPYLINKIQNLIEYTIKKYKKKITYYLTEIQKIGSEIFYQLPVPSTTAPIPDSSASILDSSPTKATESSNIIQPIEQKPVSSNLRSNDELHPRIQKLKMRLSFLSRARSEDKIRYRNKIKTQSKLIKNLRQAVRRKDERIKNLLSERKVKSDKQDCSQNQITTSNIKEETRTLEDN